MIVLLIGLVCFVAALRVASSLARRDEPVEPVRGAGAGAWLALLALLTLTQLWLGRDDLDRYRFTLLGLRHAVVGVGGQPLDRAVRVGGDDETTDVLVPGAGDAPSLELRAVASAVDSLTEVWVAQLDDAGAVGLVEERGLLGSSWTVLGSAEVGAGMVEVSGAGGVWRVELGSVSATVPFVDARVPLPWVEQPVAVVHPPGGAEPVEVRIPELEGSLASRLRGVRPSVFQRTYPLTDVLASADSTASPPPVSSFFFWQDGALRLADLDSEVELVGAPGTTRTAPVWTAREGGRRLLVAGLAHRDYPEPDLTLPERYGLRPLRSFGLDVNGRWLDVTLGSPEVRALDLAALEELRLPGGRDEAGRAVYRIRLTPGRNSLARRAVVFDAAPGTFSTAGQAVFRLPESPADGRMDVLTPSGLAPWETGRPLALGTGDRALLVRVDGQATSAVFWLVHLALFALVGAVFVTRPMTGPVFALALTAAGLACVRLLLGVSALAAYPHVQEGQQIGLWLLPMLPWALVTLAEAATARRVAAAEASDGPAPAALEGGWLFHALYVLALVALAAALFPGSPAKSVVLGGVPVAIVTLWFAARAGWRPWIGAGRRLREAAERHPRLLHGWSVGAALLLLRVVLESAGWREQLTVGGTRIGVSVLYTPLVVVAFAALLHLHDRRLRQASSGPGFPRAAAGTLLELGGFLALALLAVSGWVSDFGIALVLLPGATVVLALVGAVRAPPGRPGRMGSLALALPLLLMVLLQTAPPLMRFAWGGTVGAEDVRMGEWNRNELLLLERGDPDALQMIGQRRSEALAVMRETMRSYTRGNLMGKGFLEGRVSDEIADTATREHAVSALLASQWGLPGVLGLVLLLLALLPPVTSLLLRGAGAPRAPPRFAAVALLALVAVAFLLPSPFNTLAVALLVLAAVGVLLGPAFGVAEAVWWAPDGPPSPKGDAPAPTGGPQEGAARPDGLSPEGLFAATALFTVAFAGLYMVLANYGLAFFTGKNVYLLGLDSVGDALESLALLGMAALALGAAPAEGVRGREVARMDDDEWWRDDDGEER